MNIFDFANAQITDNNPLFIGAKVFDFIQSDKKARLSDLVRGLLNSFGTNFYDDSFAINLYGSVIQYSNSLSIVSNCAIFRNNEIFILSPSTLQNVTSLSSVYLNFLDSADGIANPQYFKDGQTGNLARVRNCTITTSPVTTGTAYNPITFDTLNYLYNYSNAITRPALTSGITPVVEVGSLTRNIQANIDLDTATTFAFPTLPFYVYTYTIKIKNTSSQQLIITITNGGISHSATVSVGAYCVFIFSRLQGEVTPFTLTSLYTS